MEEKSRRFLSRIILNYQSRPVLSFMPEDGELRIRLQNFARDIPKFEDATPQTIFSKFIDVNGNGDKPIYWSNYCHN